MSWIPSPLPAGPWPASPARAVEAARDLTDAHARVQSAERGGGPHERVEALAALARLWRAQGGLATAEAYLERALPWAAMVGEDARLDLLAECAELAAARADLTGARGPVAGAPADEAAPRRARQRAQALAREAAAASHRAACPGWEATLLLRLSDVMDRCGQPDEAAALQIRAVRLLGAGQRPPPGG